MYCNILILQGAIFSKMIFCLIINNLKTIFAMEKVPDDTQLRAVLDEAPQDELEKYLIHVKCLTPRDK